MGDSLVRENHAVQKVVTMSAKMANRERTKKKVATHVNAVARRPRGRPRVNRHADSEAGVLLRAENYRRVLSSRWDLLEPGLAQARDSEDADVGAKQVTEAWLDAGFFDGSDGFSFLSALAPRVLQVLRDKKCPKQRDDQITFLADALSGFHLAPRTAHELCERERKKLELAGKKLELAEERRAGNQIRQAVPVFDVQCSCGYRGHSVNGACPTCGALVSQW